MGMEIGQRVGDYEVLSVLGAGGMGQVYRVRNILSERIDAMKVLLPQLTAEPETGARFMAEIRTLASFSHPNIAQLRTAFHVEGQLVMVMELVEGLTIEYRTKRGRIPVDEALGFVLHLLSALSYAHARGVIHRDIKPANLMVTPQGVVKLMDFGIAKSEVQIQLTRPGMVVGSLQYMSPEQMRGVAVDARSDLYSVGILLYELLTGRRPFENDGVFSIVQQQLSMAPRPPIEINPGIPKPLNELILRALAKEPANRIQTADDFARALRVFTERQSHKLPSARQPASQRAVPPVPAAARRAESPVHVVSVVAPPKQVTPPPTIPSLAIRPPTAVASLGQRLGWIAVGICSVLIVVGVAVMLPGLLKIDPATSTEAAASASTTAPAKDPANGRNRLPTAPRAAAGFPNGDLARVRADMSQLEACATAIQGRLNQLESGKMDGRPGPRPKSDAEYAQMRSHLQSASESLKNRDIVATRRDMDKAKREISSLESSISQ